MDYLFWRSPNKSEFPWIIWYLWKAWNDKVFKNVDRNPREILQLAEAEAASWDLAQSGIQEEDPNTRNITVDVADPEAPCCYVDGSWKETDYFSGLGWYYFQDKED